MINSERIVPITVIDLISMYGLILTLAASTAPSALEATDTAGDFAVTTNSATLLANEPVKSLNFGSSVTASTVYFVAAYDYEGFSINGTAATTAGAAVAADGKSLYKAVLSTGTVTITALNL